MPQRGRPRSEKAREAILAATNDLLHEDTSLALTIEAIARRAEVGKPTIYRWWPSLADIVLEVLLHRADMEISVTDTGSLHETLHEFIRQSVESISRGAGAHLRFLMIQAQQDAEFHQRFRNNFTAKRRDTLRSIFDRAANSGQLSTRHPIELLVDMTFGAMWYRLLIGHAPLDGNFVDDITAIIVSAATS